MRTRRTAQEIALWCASRDFQLDDDELSVLSADPRKSVRRLAERVLKERASSATDHSMLCEEHELWRLGYSRVLGMDEVGRGSLAGPVCVGGVIFAPDCIVPGGVRDSKSLSAARREALAPDISSAALAHAVVCLDNTCVDRLGITAAIEECQRQIIARLKPDFLLLDGFPMPSSTLPQKAMHKGDSKSVSIAAASILAKVHRDQIMKDLCPLFQGYGFSENKGYGSKNHIQAIRELGPCGIHRTSFIKGVTSVVEE